MERFPTLESVLQAAAGLASFLCVYMVAMAFQNYFFANEFPIWYIYRRSSLEGQGPLNAHIGGAIAPPPPAPPCSAAPVKVQFSLFLDIKVQVLDIKVQFSLFLDIKVQFSLFLDIKVSFLL